MAINSKISCLQVKKIPAQIDLNKKGSEQLKRLEANWFEQAWTQVL
jgi:hypothetical protein